MHSLVTLLSLAITSDCLAALPGGLSSTSARMAAAWDADDLASSGLATNDGLASGSASMAAAWEADDALAAELQDAPTEVTSEEPVQPKSETRSIVTKHSISPPLDPFESDHRVAQLPNDPFDEPSGETIPELEQRPNLDAIENALDREMQRRETGAENRIGESNELEVTEQPSTDEEIVDEGKSNEDESDERPVDSSQISQQAPQSNLEFQLEAPERPLSETVEPIRRGIGTTPSEEAAQSQQSCEEELAALKADRISTVDLSIRIDGVPGEDYPYECPLGDEKLQPRVWPEITYTWKASALCHKPLYYEDVQLERYGHTWPRCTQPLVSGAHFFTSTAILPYKMGLETPNECVYALGHYRPGSCAPYYIEALPFTWRAAAFQAGVVTGINFALP